MRPWRIVVGVDGARARDGAQPPSRLERRGYFAAFAAAARPASGEFGFCMLVLLHDEVARRRAHDFRAAASITTTCSVCAPRKTSGNVNCMLAVFRFRRWPSSTRSIRCPVCSGGSSSTRTCSIAADVPERFLLRRARDVESCGRAPLAPPLAAWRAVAAAARAGRAGAPKPWAPPVHLARAGHRAIGEVHLTVAVHPRPSGCGRSLASPTMRTIGSATYACSKLSAKRLLVPNDGRDSENPATFAI